MTVTSGSSEQNAETILPKIEDRTELSANRKNQTAFEPGLRHILRDCGLGDAVLSATVGGSMPVFGVNDDLVIKLFPHFCREHFENELVSLQTLAGQTPFTVPEIKESGDCETWSFIVMTRVPGVQLASVWPDADSAKKEILLENLGRANAALHQVATATPEETTTWRAFMASQARNCVEHHRGKLSEDLLAQIPGYIAPALEVIEAAPVVFLHTELMLEHVFIDPDDLTIQSMIDFEPSIMGAIEYDFTGVPVFMTQGREQLLTAFLRGYGYRWRKPSAKLLMTYLLLHRYSNIGWFLELLGDNRPKKVTHLEELEELWWSA